MSLIGSLEDLSLGDILQIISLSQKSGVLALDTTGSAGRIVFVDGLVRGAAVKNGPEDLRGVLVGGGFMADDEFSAAAEHAATRDCDVKSALNEIGIITAERIESLCREAVESAVITMFSWTKGEFSFDVRSEPIPGDPELLSPDGLNAQYLAMESARVDDEDEAGMTACVAAPGMSVAEENARFDEMSAHEMFGVTADADADADTNTDAEPGPTIPDHAAAVDTLAMAGVARVDTGATVFSEKADALADEIMQLAAVVGDPADGDPADIEEAFVEEIDCDGPAERAPNVAPSEGEPVDDADLLLVEAVPAHGEDGAAPFVDAVPGSAGVEEIADAPSPIPPLASAPPRALVVIDGDLIALEWIKSALAERFDPIHIFQQTDPAMTRIRQYLVRGEPPVVLIAPGIPVDRLGGVVNAVDFVTRLKAQSPRMLVMWLREEGTPAIARMGAVDGVVVRPEPNQLRAAKGGDDEIELAAAFARQMEIDAGEPAGERTGEASTAGRSISPDALRRLRDATKALTEASSRGEVLPLVIRFASEVFSRVAMFLVHDGTAVGMAQHGLESCGGPNDRDLRELAYPCSSSSWIGRVLEQCAAVRGAPGNDGDRALAGLLGDRVPAEAYVAPIESTGQVIALLYGDNLPADSPIGDTSALEVVLHHAGLALDRAVLERALLEDQG